MGALLPRVMVVDDDPAVLTGLQRLAQGLPLQLECWPTAELAWESLQASSPAALLSDYRLPGMDGVTLLERAQALYPKLRCMLHTGEAVHRTSIPLDFPVISKPCAPLELREVLLSLILP